MTTASIPPEKLILFGALAIGAYWFTTKRAQAGQVPVSAQLFAAQNRSPAVPGASTQGIYEPNYALAQTLGSVANKLFGGFFSSPMSTASATPTGPAPTTGDFARMDRLGSSTVDGIAANPSQDTPVINALDPNAWGEG